MSLMNSIGAAIPLSALAVAAQAITLDLTALPNGPYTGNADVTFSLSGVGVAGDPVIDDAFDGGLWNTVVEAEYPSNTQLQAAFAGAVTGVTWLFDNEGTKTTTYSIYDENDVLIASGENNIDTDFQFYDFSALTIGRIVWDNDGNDWLFALGQITYEPLAMPAVPVPAGLPLALTGLAALGVLRRRKKT